MNPIVGGALIAGMLAIAGGLIKWTRNDESLGEIAIVGGLITITLGLLMQFIFL
jgi:hypothetical protein